MEDTTSNVTVLIPEISLLHISNRKIIQMPLDTSTTYPLTKLRLDGRRWNELRLLQAQISTNPASSGSSYLSMGNTAIMCSVHGPAEGRRGEGGGAGSSAGATVEVDVNVAGFALVDRKRRAGGSDRYGGVFSCLILFVYDLTASCLYVADSLRFQTIHANRDDPPRCLPIASSHILIPAQYHTHTCIRSLI